MAGSGNGQGHATDRKVGWAQVARAAHDLANLPNGLEPGLEAHDHYDVPAYCYPSGCHVCEVEIDRDTGAV